MINYTEKGIGLHKAIQEAGHSLSQVDGEWVSSDDDAVQAIIDSFDPKGYLLPIYADEVNTAAGKARVRYSTNIPFQEASYQLKEAEVYRYRDAGYPEDLSAYPFTYAESDATGQTPREAADSIIALSQQWALLLSEIERLRRKAIVLMESETDWQNLKLIRDEYVTALESI